MKKIYPVLIKGVILLLLLFFDMYRWGVPFLSLVLLTWFWSKNITPTIGLLAYLGTAYGIYLANPPKNLIQIIVVWLIETPIKSVIPFFILLFIISKIDKILKRNNNKIKIDV